MLIIVSIMANAIFCNSIYSQIRYDNGGILIESSSSSEYTIHGNKWNKQFVTYFFDNITNDITHSESAKESIRTAFKTWQNITRLYFIEGCNINDADIVIRFASGNHGEGESFDGVNGVLAHAFFPPPNAGSLAGDVHFDDSETWSLLSQNSSSQPIDLQTVALHEIGHSLGLAHSTVSGAVMYAYYGGTDRDLESDDINGIRTIYGSLLQELQVL